MNMYFLRFGLASSLLRKGNVPLSHISQFLLITKELETQEQLKIAHIHLKEHQETIDKLRERVSEKTSQISNIQKDLNKSKDELQKKVCVILSFGGTCCMLNHFSRVPIFCNPMDCSLPGSSVHGILQARILEWVAIPFSKGSS